MKALSTKQKHIAKQAPPANKITGADFKKLKSMKESGDHEVSMAQSSLDGIIKAAQELMMKLGSDERDIPGWIQNHITNAENYIEQAAQGFHELEGKEKDDISLMKIMQELVQPNTGMNNAAKPVQQNTQNKSVKGTIKTDVFANLGIEGYKKSAFETAVSKVKRGAASSLTRNEKDLLANTFIAMINTKDDSKINQIASNLKTVEA